MSQSLSYMYGMVRNERTSTCMCNPLFCRCTFPFLWMFGSSLPDPPPPHTHTAPHRPFPPPQDTPQNTHRHALTNLNGQGSVATTARVPRRVGNLPGLLARHLLCVCVCGMSVCECVLARHLVLFLTCVGVGVLGVWVNIRRPKKGADQAAFPLTTHHPNKPTRPNPNPTSHSPPPPTGPCPDRSSRRPQPPAPQSPFCCVFVGVMGWVDGLG
jgi:hypothetical protein